jgi:hypothetical protein
MGMGGTGTCIPTSMDTGAIVEDFKLQLHLPFFMEIIVTMCWAIWTMRNDIIFRNISHSSRDADKFSDKNLP